MEIREVTGKIEKMFDKNGMIIAGAVFGGLFLIAYFVQSKKEQSETVKITGAYSSYPDTVTNANVIIDTMQQSTDYQTDELKQYADDLLSEYQGSYPYTGEIDLNGLNEEIESAYSKVNDLVTNATTTTSQLKSLIDSIQTANKIPVSSNNGTTKESTDTYFKKTPYKGVSIVDGLKAIGEYEASSFVSRTRIAKANGINNYTGTASQNTTLLNKLKAGTLKRG